MIVYYCFLEVQRIVYSDLDTRDTLCGSFNFKKNASRKVVGKRTFHKTGDQLKDQGPDLFQINYRSAIKYKDTKDGLTILCLPLVH